MLGHLHHQAAARRNRRRGRAAGLPFPEGHLHQRLAGRIDRDEALNRKLRHHLPLATAVIEPETDLRQQQVAVIRTQSQNIVWRALRGRYFAACQLGRSLVADDLAIVQPQQIHPLGADCISDLVVGVEPNGQWAGHWVRLFCF